MIRVADYIMKTLADRGVRQIFLVTGGGAMHLNDAIVRETRIAYTCNHHEQACAMAAEGYARVTGEIGVINVTTGPGGINSLNGVFGAWTDSIPMLVISGQVKRETCISTYNIPGLRQLGDQEVDIIPMVKGITKYAVQITEPESIRYHLDRALHLAQSGKPGPCWIDVPIDVQSSQVDEDSMPAYDPSVDDLHFDMADVRKQCREIVERIAGSPRPVLMAGTGVRLAGACDVFNRVIEKLGIPVTTAWTHDLIASDNPLFCGRPGTIGDRAGNFTVQNSETLLVIGSRLNIRQVSYNWGSFARCAFKIQVDVDRAEMQKPTVRPDMPVWCDAKLFLEELERAIDSANYDSSRHTEWLAWCKERVRRYPTLLPRHRAFNGKINPYYFVHELAAALDDDDVIVCGNGSATIIPFQVAELKAGQRLFSNSGSASMGYDLPASLGAAVARRGKRVICLAGDGSLQMNIQELETVRFTGLPVKIFVLNNSGYLSIKQTQRNFFGRMIGESRESGVSFPDYVKVGSAYGIPSVRIDREDFMPQVLAALADPGPVLCDVILDPDQGFEPKLQSRQLSDGRMVSPALEDMYPFLDRAELLDNLKIPPQDAG
jgi:acetolactate synthase-1/2/3 large subunit